MMLHPGIIALIAASLVTGAVALFAALFAVRLLSAWDLSSGSRMQLALERRTYLVSVLLGIALVIQLFSLFLFITTVDSLSSLFTGAMCAAGTLNAGAGGYTVLILKVITFLLASLWLIINHADNRAYDYPLIKKKYVLLLFLTPLMIVESLLQARFFLSLEPEVITSCCGSMFSATGQNAASDIASFPAGAMQALFTGTLAAAAVAGLLFLIRKTGAVPYTALSLAVLLVSLASILSFISPYIYELPTHHCPFCLLKREYRYVGYLVYVALFSGAVTGMAAGALAPFRGIASLSGVIPRLEKTLVIISLLAFGIFSVVVLYLICVSHLVR